MKMTSELTDAAVLQEMMDDINCGAIGPFAKQPADAGAAAGSKPEVFRS